MDVRVDLSDPRAVIRRYYLFRALAAVGFVTPVFALFVLRDLTYPEYGALSAVYSLVLVGGEIPTGYVGDRIGRRDALVASKVAMALSLFGFLVVESFASYFAMYVVWGVGMALASGAESAWLYEVLEVTLGEGEFTTVRGKGNAIERWSSAGTMIVGAVLYGIDPRLPFVAGGFVMLAGDCLLLTMPRTSGFADGSSAATGPPVREVLPLLRERLARPPLRAFVLLVALLFGVVGAANGYIQPIAVAVAGDVSLPTAPVVGGVVDVDGLAADLPLSAATGLGPMYASFAAVGAAVSYYAGPIEARLGLRRVLVAVAAIVVGTLALPLALPLAAVAAFYVVQSVGHLLQPMVERYVNDRVEDVGRATVLSAVSMVFGLARTPFVVLAGFAAGDWGPVAAFPALAVLFCVAALPLMVFGTPLPAPATPDVAAEKTPQ